MTTTSDRVQAACAVAADLEDKLDTLCEGGADDLRTRLLIGEEIIAAHAAAKVALKHLLNVTQMAANAEWARGLYAELAK